MWRIKTDCITISRIGLKRFGYLHQWIASLIVERRLFWSRIIEAALLKSWIFHCYRLTGKVSPCHSFVFMCGSAEIPRICTQFFFIRRSAPKAQWLLSLNFATEKVISQVSHCKKVWLRGHMTRKPMSYRLPLTIHSWSIHISPLHRIVEASIKIIIVSVCSSSKKMQRDHRKMPGRPDHRLVVYCITAAVLLSFCCGSSASYLCISFFSATWSESILAALLLQVCRSCVLLLNFNL